MADGSPFENSLPDRVPESRPVSRLLIREHFNLEWLAILGILLLNLVLVAPKLMPSIAEINPDDEAKYVESGRYLLDGSIRDLAWGPLVAVIYAPLHLVVGNSPDWFLLEVWAARFILFIFPWLSIYYLSRQFRDFLPPLVAAGVLFVTAPFFLIVKNQSDSLFIGFSALALAKLLAYHRERRIRDVGLASLFVGLGVLCRVETIVLVGSLAVIALVIAARAHDLRQNGGKVLLAAVLPAAGILALYLLAILLTTGKIDLGTGGKSYLAFESNQPLTVRDSADSRAETARLFGTREENQGSVLRAILRNPPAFLQRVFNNAKTIPTLYLGLFGKRLGLLLLLFSLWGIYWLVKKGAAPALIILFGWSLHVLIPLAFLILHIVPQASYLPLLLGAIGIAASLDPDLTKRERIVLLSAAALFTLANVIGQNPSLWVAGLLVTAVFVLDGLLRRHLPASGRAQQVSLLLMLAAGLILHGPYTLLSGIALGQSNQERAIHYMEQALPPGSRVLVPTGLQAVASKMDTVLPAAVPARVVSSAGLWEWLNHNKIRAVYADSHFQPRPEIDRLVRGGSGQYFENGYTTPDGNLTVFLVRPP